MSVWCVLYSCYILYVASLLRENESFLNEQNIFTHFLHMHIGSIRYNYVSFVHETLIAKNVFKTKEFQKEQIQHLTKCTT